MSPLTRAIKPQPGASVELFEFTSSGGRGESLSRQEKNRFLIFYEGGKMIIGQTRLHNVIIWDKNISY